jgi:hypothetical protein
MDTKSPEEHGATVSGPVGAPPVFLTVKVCEVLNLPTGTDPKSTLVGASTTRSGGVVVDVVEEVVMVVAAVAVPERLMDTVPPGEAKI